MAYKFLKSLFDGNRGKFLVASLLVTGGYFVVRFIRRKLLDLQLRIFLDKERKARESLEKLNRSKNFLVTQHACEKMIQRACKSVCAIIIQECNTDRTLQQLRENPINKVDLWEKIKIISFTRLITMIHAASLVSVTFRVQFSILGGYMHRDTLSEDKMISEELRRQYICLTKYFLRDGLFKLIQLVRKKVVNQLKSMPLQSRLSYCDLKELLLSLKMSIDRDESESYMRLFQFVLPPELEANALEGTLLQKTYEETLEVLERVHTSQVLLYEVCYGFSVAAAAIAQMLDEFKQASSAEKDSRNSVPNAIDEDIVFGKHCKIEQGNNKDNKVPLAKIIPVLCGLTSHSYGNTEQHLPGFVNSLIAHYKESENCRIFGATVFEEFASSMAPSGEEPTEFVDVDGN